MKQMSKKVLSLLLCTALILGVFPGAVWAENGTMRGRGFTINEAVYADGMSESEGGSSVILPEGNVESSSKSDVISSDVINQGEESSSDQLGEVSEPAVDPQEKAEEPIADPLEEVKEPTVEPSTEDQEVLISLLKADEVTAISSEEELRNIEMTGSYKLTGDIALTSENWKALGTEDKPFAGTFDGNGYTISGISIESELSNLGLFGIIGTGGTVKNLTVAGKIDRVSSKSGGFIGGIAGKSSGTIQNCVNRVNINSITGSGIATQYVGGIVGSVESAPAVIGCANLGSVAGKNYVGGIAGQAKDSSISYCYNTATISDRATKGKYVAGLVGTSSGGGSLVRSYNAGTINITKGSSAGLLVGWLYGMSMSNCYWSSDLAGSLTSHLGTGSAENISGFNNEYMKKAGFIDTLNPKDKEPVPSPPAGSRFAADPGGLNNGYPVLEHQLPKVEKYQVTFELTPKKTDLKVRNSQGVDQPGANGVYRLPAGEYTYAASAFGYQPIVDKKFTVTDDAFPGTITVNLTETNRTTVSFSGLPEGAKLTFAGAEQIVPDADGLYHLPSGEYSYTVIAKGYVPLVNKPLKVGEEPVNQTVSMTALGTPKPWDGLEKTPVNAIENTYYIQNSGELAWFASETINGRLLDARVVLIADINLGDKPWSSIGPYGKLFEGNFDGNGCTVSGLAGECYGFFYGIASGGIVENLTVTGSITGESNIGGIVGVNYGTVRNCGSSVTISAAKQRIGGIAGNNSGGIISGCASLMPVSSSFNVFNDTVSLGGIAGQNSGIIESSYSASKVTATGQNHNGDVGGIAGASTGNIKNCYSVGTVSYAGSPDKSVGAIAGTIVNKSTSGIVQNSFYLEGSCAKGVGTGSTDGVQGKNDSELKRYPVVILLNEGSAEGPFYLASGQEQNDGYPVLKWQGGKVPVATADELAVAADKAALNLSRRIFTNPGALVLPKSGASGSTITWKSSVPEIISDAGIVSLPTEQSRVDVVLTATLTKGSVQDTKTFTITAYSAKQVTLNYLAEAKASLGRVLAPVCGRDENIIRFVEDLLADRGFGDVTVELKKTGKLAIGEGTQIAQDGTITYFYRDPSSSSGMNVAIVQEIAFTLSKDGQSVSWNDVQANIPWDRDRVMETLQKEVAANLTWDAIKNKNNSPKEVTTTLKLPIKLDHARWATILWEADSSVIYPEDYAPDAVETSGRVFRLSVDAQVNLTAIIRFNLTETNERDITVEVPFDLTVSGSEGADTPEKMQKKLEGYTLEKLTDLNTKSKLDPNGVKGDIQFPTPVKTGIADYSAYRFTVTSKNTSVLEVNGYRGYVYRPLPGNEPAVATFTVTMTNRANPALSASKDMEVTVLPLEQAEIDEAIRLMEAVRADYANAILGGNPDKNAISENLSIFREAVFGQDGKSLVYSRKIGDDTDRGICVDDLPGSGPDGPGYEIWRTFRSSRPDILSHEFLRLTRPEYDTTVTVESCLTHEVLGKYALKYPKNHDFKELYQVSIVAPLTVKGTSGGENPNPDKTFSVSFSLDGKGFIESISTVLVENLEKPITVYEVFQRVLNDKNFTYKAKGGYVSAVTDSKGVSLSELEKGENSGWMYKVNGEFPDKIMNAYYLKGKEKIEFLYTADWVAEPGTKGGMAPEIKGGTILKPAAVTDRNGEAIAEVSSKDLAAAVDAAKKDGASSIVIQPEVKGEASKITVTLAKDSVASIVKNTSAKLTLKTAAGEITLPKAALSDLVKKSGETVSLSVGLVKDASGKSSGAVTMVVSVGGVPVENLSGGIIAKLKADKPSGTAVLMAVTGSSEKVIKKFLLEGNTITALLEGSATVIVKDNSKSYTDVTDGYWGKEAVAFASSRELFQGTGETTFTPNGTMTRSMFVTVLHRLENEAEPKRNTDFDDVKQADWYASAASWAASVGIVNGTGSGLDPNGSISREQLAAMLYRYSKTAGVPSSSDVETMKRSKDSINGFSDATSVSPWAQEAVAWAVSTGLISGRGSDTLAPGATATRAEVAAIFQRFIPELLK